MKINLIHPSNSIKDALKAMKINTDKCLIVVDKNNKLLGSLSDGDIRSAILKNISINVSINKIYQKKCIYFDIDNYRLEKAKNVFIKGIIGLIPIVDKKHKVVKILNWKNVFINVEKKPQQLINLPVVIMAGGRGKRLDPFTRILPKALMPINEKTIIEYIIDRFLKFGIKNFYLSLNYKSLIIKSFFKELEKNYKTNFVVENKPLGTVGSLRLLNKKLKTTFFLTNCDVIIYSNYYDIYNFHKKNKNDLTLVVSTKQITIPYGTCELDKKGMLKKIIEKPEYDLLVNTGLYLLESKIINLIPKNKFFDFNELINICKKKNKKIGVFPIDEDSWIDIGQWSEYKKTFNQL